MTKLFRRFIASVLLIVLILPAGCQSANKSKSESGVPVTEDLIITIDTRKQYQTMSNFGASDCWSAQFIGKNWPESKRNAMADLLFSSENDVAGKPKGIGLSLWRFNIGAGSAEQGDNSNINSPWRRSECFLNGNGTYDWTKQAGQRWFLRAAKQRGVENFLGFTNSPPVSMTSNGLSNYKDVKTSSYNLKKDGYAGYADFLVNVVKGIKETDGVELNYLSPFNEPEWDWSGNSQEGSPATNSEIAGTVRLLDKNLTDNNLATQIVVCESGKYDYLYGKSDKPGCEDHLNDFFTSASPDYIGDLHHVPALVTGHGYFTTTPATKLLETRTLLGNALKAKNTGFWQTEFCMLENDNQVGGGPGKDLTMQFALYVARVIHFDITSANASAWQWWLAITTSDYKDGLIYADENPNDGSFTDSKLLWSLGNFSRFVRPGSIRIDVNSNGTGLDNPNGLMVSSYLDNLRKELVIVAVNYSSDMKPFNLKVEGVNVPFFIPYITSDTKGDDLKPLSQVSSAEKLTLPARTIITYVGKIK